MSRRRVGELMMFTCSARSKVARMLTSGSEKAGVTVVRGAVHEGHLVIALKATVTVVGVDTAGSFHTEFVELGGSESADAAGAEYARTRVEDGEDLFVADRPVLVK